jgi:hypothetical protein
VFRPAPGRSAPFHLVLAAALLVSLLAAALVPAGAPVSSAPQGAFRPGELGDPDPGSDPVGALPGAPGAQPATLDAFAHLVPGEITVTLGTKFSLDLKINTGSNTVRSQQSYLTFPNSQLQVVDPAQSGCVAATTFTPDYTIFNTLLQNVADNSTGELAYASATFGTPAPPATDFRVASISFCGTALGDAILHWQFRAPPPPHPPNQKKNRG